MQSFAVSGRREIQNYLDVVAERFHPGGRDAVAEEVEVGDGEHALAEVESQSVGGEDGERVRRCCQCWSLVLLYTPSSSKKEKMKYNPIRILSLRRWRAGRRSEDRKP